MFDCISKFLHKNDAVFSNHYSICAFNNPHTLCDQGGIDIIEVQPGTVVHGNVVKNVFSYATYMWSIYLDNGASNIIVSNNVVYNGG
jgi:hypothetical protein